MRHNTKQCDIIFAFFISVRALRLVFLFCLMVFVAVPGFSQKVDAALSKNPDAGAVKQGQADVTAKTFDKKNSERPEEGIPGVTSKNYGENDFRPQTEEGSYAWLVIKTIIILGLIVGGFYYFFRFVTKKAGVNVVGEDVVTVLSVVPVGQNKFLQVVDIAGKMLVLGVTDASINVVTEITEKEDRDRIRLLSSRSTVPPVGGFQESFMKHLGKVVQRVGSLQQHPRNFKDRKGSSSESPGLGYLKNQKKRLKNMNEYNDE